MTLTRIVATTDVVIDLDEPPRGHRLAELVQALTGCSVELAELAVDDPIPAGPAAPSDALDMLARAMVAVRASRTGAALPQVAHS